MVTAVLHILVQADAAEGMFAVEIGWLNSLATTESAYNCTYGWVGTLTAVLISMAIWVIGC